MEGPKKNFEFKVIVILMVVFIMVLFTGVVTYNRFSTIVNRISEASRPDLRLVAAHSLENDLTLLGNYAKTYSLTNDTLYLDRFFVTASEVERQTLRLAEMNQKATDDLNMVELDSLISEKFAVLNELLFSQDQFRVQQALSKVVSTIEESSKVKPENKSSIVSEQTVEEKPKRKLLGWVKRNKKEEEKAEVVDDVIPYDAVVEVRDVSKEIKQIQSEEMHIENRMKDSELQ